jgi:hypothetical protein
LKKKVKEKANLWYNESNYNTMWVIERRSQCMSTASCREKNVRYLRVDNGSMALNGGPMKKVEACLVCGEELVYFKEGREMECMYCHKKFMSNAACKNGHYICDHCHSVQAIEHIKTICKQTESRNPLEIAVAMMKDTFVHMHGPENHVLVGLALLAGYKNSGGTVAFDEAVEELARRGSQVPGGICGLWGNCGAAVSTGIFISIVTGSTPLSTKSFGLCNKMTAASLAEIGEIGGPRCCKRNAFLAIKQAVKFCKNNLAIEMEEKDKYVCEFTQLNAQCIGKRCPFNPNK